MLRDPVTGDVQCRSGREQPVVGGWPTTAGCCLSKSPRRILHQHVGVQEAVQCICAVYLSPNSSDYVKFFDYLTSKVEYILPPFPYAEISISGDFNVHFGFQAFSFATLYDLE